jgi:predicted nucleic acid-binding protein
MSAALRIFLDTTIQIKRVIATQARQAEIGRALAGAQVISSTYVLGEFLRTLVQDALVLHNLALRSEQLYDVETQIAHLLNKRSASRCLLLWASLHRLGLYERPKLLRTLRIYIEYGLVNRFMLGVDELLDTTACGLARERPAPLGEVYRLRTQCTRPAKECDLAERLAEHQSELRVLANGLKDHPESALARVSGLCRRILEDPAMARGRNCTWYLGDLIIALELPADAALYTTNHRHFEPLCTLLGKRLYMLET